MTTRNRVYLKGKFATGQIPAGAEYSDLIDSFFNKTDDTLISSINGQTADPLGNINIPVASSIVNQGNHGFLVGDILYFNGSTYEKALAENSAKSNVVGIVSGIINLNNFTLLTSGLITSLTGLIPGAVYYLSDVASGALTTTAPTANNTIQKIMLVAISSTSGYYNINAGFLNDHAAHIIQKEGISFIKRPALNFKGDALAITDNADNTEIELLLSLSASATATWGQITGAVSGQSDLNDLINGAVSGKAPIDNPLFTGVASGTFAGTFNGNSASATEAVSAGTASFATSASSAGYSSDSDKLNGFHGSYYCPTVSAITVLNIGSQTVANITGNLPISQVTDLTANLNAKVPIVRKINNYPLSANITLTKDDIGLGNVDNVSVTASLANKADLVGGLVPISQLPSYVDDVQEYVDYASFPATGSSGKIYVDMTTEKIYRWAGSVYIQISENNVKSINNVAISGTGNVTLEELGIGAARKFVLRDRYLGDVNGSNTTFQVQKTVIAGTETIYKNGLFLFPGIDYYFSFPSTFVFVSPPEIDDLLAFNYETSQLAVGSTPVGTAVIGTDFMIGDSPYPGYL